MNDLLQLFDEERFGQIGRSAGIQELGGVRREHVAGDKDESAPQRVAPAQQLLEEAAPAQMRHA